MRILWVKVGGLWPPNTGGRLRSFHLVRELARGHAVTLLTTHTPSENPLAQAEHLRECREVVSVPFVVPKRTSVRFALALGRSWLSSLPVDVSKFRVTALAAEVRRRLAAGEADVCVVDFLSALINVPRESPVPVVLFAHNVEHMIWKRLCLAERRPWRRLLLELEWRKLRRYEAHACARADLTIAVSEQDRALLSAHAAGARVVSIPTGVDTAYFAPNGAHERAAALVFTGSMDWHPNEDAVLHFLDAILPRIRRDAPEVSFAVVGRNPSSRLRAAASAARVAVTGTVDDVRPYVGQAAVYVVPLRIGGGTRLKIFEALAMGKTVVSTAVGAEGLPLVDGEHFVAADDPAEFARAVVALLGDPVRRRALGQAGRRLVETRYSWAQVAREFESRCVALVDR